MVEHFSDVLIRGSSPLIPVDESIRNIRVLDALAEAARSGQTVVLSEKQI
jgi:D-xylose 1-dehydrogenase (NADP+, D-xylono-1,5-lactone-forming)